MTRSETLSVRSRPIVGLRSAAEFAYAMLVVGALLAVASSAALAQQTLSPEDARKLLEDGKKALGQERLKRQKLENELAADRAEYDRLQARLLETAKMIQASEAQMSAIEDQRGKLEAQREVVRGSLEVRLSSMSAMLAAMQRMGRNPPPVMITKPQDALAMVRSGNLLAPLLPEMSKKADELSSQLADLDRLTAGIALEGKKLENEKARYEETRLRLASLMDAKKRTLSEQQEELEKVKKATAEIARNVTDLNELLSKLDKAVAENTRMAEYERKLKAAIRYREQQPEPQQGSPSPGEAPNSSTDQPPSTPGTAPEGKVAEQKTPVQPKKRDDTGPNPVTLAPGGALAMASPSRIQPAIPFAQARARLPLPAQGRRILSFGDKTQTGGKSQGIVIETRHGAQITSPSDGWILYAGVFRSYGQILIINGGGGYHLLLAGLSRIDVQLGQFVLAGEPVGVMAAAARPAASQGQENAPVLYVEFRKDQKPIDPEPWWADASRKLQG